MQSFHGIQINHYKEDLYDLDIEFKDIDLSMNIHENVHLSGAVCTPACVTTGC
ncbi:MAG: gallidermin family lantibiotic [Candidatus Rhabdochlamydia sp.]